MRTLWAKEAEKMAKKRIKKKARKVVRKRPFPNIQSRGSASSGMKIWLEELRAPFFTATIIPVILGTLVAWVGLGAFSWPLFILTLAGVICLHAGTNIANDYYDHKSGNDEFNKDYIKGFSGGSRLIQRGMLEPLSVLRGAFAFFIVGAIIGLLLIYLTKGIAILFLGIVGMASGYFYTAPPIRLADRGMGEIVVGLNFGILVVMGAYYVQALAAHAQGVSLEAFIISLPVAFLITQVLYINQFPDYRADKHVGKDNLVVRLGKKKAVNGYIILSLATYGSILFGIAFDLIPQITMIGILTAPLSVISARELRINFDDVSKLAPTCGRTVMTHLFSGILLIIAYIIEGLFIKGGRLL